MRLERRINIEMGGVRQAATVVVGPIEQAGDDCVCHYYLPGVDIGHGKCYGVDAIQALELALGHISSVIDGAIDEEGVRVWWLEEGDRGGFPEIRST